MSVAQIQNIIAAGTEHRGWIANSFAQIEFLLSKLIVRCRALAEWRLPGVRRSEAVIWQRRPEPTALDQSRSFSLPPVNVQV